MHRRSLFIIAIAGIFWVFVAHAAQFNRVSDTISDSRLSWPANHDILFQTPQGIPASGQIVIAFEGSAFSIDPSFSASDVDLAVSTSSIADGFVDQPLAVTPDATHDGAAVTPVTGPITITLSASGAIPPGAYVRILLGTNAPGGVYQVTNPSSTASYRIFLNSYDGSADALDYGTAMVAILPAVGVDVNQDRIVPAVLSNGLPTGTIPSNVNAVLASFNTDVFASCRYATSSGVSYDAMTGSADDDALGTFHTITVAPIAQGDTYNLYIRCKDFAGNENMDDYLITFLAGDPTGTGQGGGQPGGNNVVNNGSGGGGGGGGAGGYSYPPGPSMPTLDIRGITIPNANVGVLEDGSKIPVTTVADGSGNFSLNIASLPQGTYSFTVQASNGGSTPIASYSATITLVSGTSNDINGIVLPPAIDFATSTVGIGKKFAIGGLSEPSAVVSILVTSQAGLRNPFTATTTANQGGAWSYSLATAGFPADTYQVRAQSQVIGLAASAFSPISFLGIGQTVSPKLKMGDLNGDNKVNLVDFSVMLVHWGTDYPPDDLNGDGVVDLPDLSILLSHWTG